MINPADILPVYPLHSFDVSVPQWSASCSHVCFLASLVLLRHWSGCTPCGTAATTPKVPSHPVSSTSTTRHGPLSGLELCETGAPGHPRLAASRWIANLFCDHCRVFVAVAVCPIQENAATRRPEFYNRTSARFRVCRATSERHAPHCTCRWRFQRGRQTRSRHQQWRRQQGDRSWATVPEDS